MTNKLYNGFNNGRSPSDGVGGRKPDYQTNKLVTMTEQQKKADELVERFTKALTVNSWAVLKVDVIQCAIICVEEILSEQPDTVHGYTNEGQLLVVDNFRKYYWKSVLNELKSRL